MILRFVGGIVALVILCVSAYAQADDLALIAKMDQEMLRPTVRVDMDNGTGSGSVIYRRSSGGGAQCGVTSVRGKQICISGVTVLTNYHVVESQIIGTGKKKKQGAASPSVMQVGVTFFEYSGPFSDQLTAHDHKATIVAWDKKRDLALLNVADVPGRLVAVAPLAPRGAKPRWHGKAWRAGAASGFEPLITEGIFGSIDLRPGEVAPLIASTPISEGSSGGGVYHFSSGHFEMIAVSAKGAQDTKNRPIEHVSLSIMIQTVHDFFAENGLQFVSEWHAAQPR